MTNKELVENVNKLLETNPNNSVLQCFRDIGYDINYCKTKCALYNIKCKPTIEPLIEKFSN